MTVVEGDKGWQVPSAAIYKRTNLGRLLRWRLEDFQNFSRELSLPHLTFRALSAMETGAEAGHKFYFRNQFGFAVLAREGNDREFHTHVLK